MWRLASRRFSRRVVAIWIAGQAGALGLLALLYVTQISKLKGSASAQHMQVLLANSYFHRGHDHLLGFIFAKTFAILQYTFGQLVIGDIAGLFFVAAVVLLLTGKDASNGETEPKRAAKTGPSSRQLALLLTLPFAINAAFAIADTYPYGGTRHSAFLLPFAVAGVSLAIARLLRQRLAPSLVIAILLVAVCQLFGTPHRPYMRREDQRRSNMTQALDAIRQDVSPDDVILVDFQTSFLLRFYLCPEVGPAVCPPPISKPTPAAAIA